MNRLPVRAAAALCALSMAFGALAQTGPNTLPALGDPVSGEFAVGTERKLGDQIMREIRRDPDYGDDPLLLEYLQTLWQPLVSRARAAGHIDAEVGPRFAWEAFLVRDRSVNAFALPGGYVGVHYGLIAMTATRDELASVLAHELSHVTQRHIARGIVNSKRQSLLSVAATILGVIAASRNAGDAANALIVGGQGAAIQGQLNFSRDMEREADRIGFSVLTGAGFSPGGMAAMFEKLEQSTRLMDNNAYPYLRSHPLSTERIGDARSRLGAADAPRLVSGGALEHAAAAGRARVLMDPRVDALRRWQSEGEARPGQSATERLSAAVASALASTLLRDWARADVALRDAVALTQGTAESRTEPRATRAVLMLQAQSLVARGDAPAALALLKRLGDDGSRPVLLLTTQAAVAAHQPDDPLLKRQADELQTWTTVHPLDADAWQAAAQAWARLGQPLRAVRAEAEARYALGDLAGAADRLRAGQRQARGGSAGVDHIEASVIDARLREIEGQRRQLALEERAGG